jgi:hypothetical protein
MESTKGNRTGATLAAADDEASFNWALENQDETELDKIETA